MSADQYPDYDLGFLDGETGNNLAAVGRGLESAARGLEDRIADLESNSAGTTVERVHGELIEIKQSIDKAAAAAAEAAAAFKSMQSAWKDWKANAPKHAELVAAEAEVAKAREALKAADNHHAGLFRGALHRAQDRLREMIKRREAADKALADALESTAFDLGAVGGLDSAKPIDAETPPAAAAPPAGTPPAAGTPPTAGTPAVGTPPAAEATPPPAGTAPETVSTTPSSESPAGSVSPAVAAALGAALTQQQPQPQQAAPAAAIPQMPQVPMPGAGQQQQNRPGGAEQDKPLDTPDIAALLAGMPITGSTSTLPGTTSATPPPVTVAAPMTSPSFAPAAPWSSGISLSNPLPPVSPAPVTTGTSIPGLTTTANVTGLPDGTPAKTAFTTNPVPAVGSGGAASHLSGSAPVGPGGGSVAGSPGAGGMMGPAGMPMMPPMMGAGPGGAGAGDRERERILAYTPDEAVLHGIHAENQAVPGGTIAQKKPGDAA